MSREDKIYKQHYACFRCCKAFKKTNSRIRMERCLRIVKTKPTYSRLIVSSVMMLSILLCSLVCKGQTLSNAATLERNEQKKEKSAGVSCLSNEPKPDVRIRLGVLNRKTMKMPKPTYPMEARRKGISGEVKVEVVIDVNTGVIEWAQITT